MAFAAALVASALAVPWAGPRPEPGASAPATVPNRTAAVSVSTGPVQTGPADVPRIDGNWSRIEHEASGPAGSWVYAYQPLSEPEESLGMDVTYDLTVSGDPDQRVVAFAASPMPAVDEGDGFNILARAIDPPILVGEGEVTRHIELGFGLGVAGGTIPGVGWAVGADAPWEVSMTVTLGGDGPTTRPLYEHGGRGLAVLDDNPIPVASQAVGRAGLDDEVPGPGWTTLQVLYDVLQPDDVRNMDAVFPDGTEFHRRSYRLGIRAGSFCVATWGHDPVSDEDVVDLYGTYTDEPGTLDAGLIHAGGSTNVRLMAVHLPIAPADLPDGNLRGGFASETFICKGTR